MKLYKVIMLPANKSVTGKDVYGVVAQSHTVGDNHILIVENVSKEKAVAVKDNLLYSSDPENS